MFNSPKRFSDYFNPRSPHGERPAVGVQHRYRAYFNPRSPHGERPITFEAILCDFPFQSTLPARGATQWANYWYDKLQFQSTLPARGATGFTMLLLLARHISIHAPRTGSDATVEIIQRHMRGISIHAPRTGSDKSAKTERGITMDFNPRSPHGERPEVEGLLQGAKYFNPRSPHGERR